ncbi:MAG: mannose-1-phosphate guanylyltransferase [Candidatus Binatia bacterium]
MTIPSTASGAKGGRKRPGRVEVSRRFAVVMAGGSGTRFWPWSREAWPKQLLSLVGPRSMLAETVARLDGLVPAANIFVVTGRRYRRQVLKELPGLPPANVLAEPVGRNTAPCIAWATLEIRRRREDAVVAVLSADHRIGKPATFRRDFDQALIAADRLGRLVTFGVPPTSPATGYGYLRAGKPLEKGLAALAVQAFVEKPNLATARRYVADGKYFWNSGMFVWRADVIWQELSEHLPGLVAAMGRMDRQRSRGRLPAAVLDKVWPRLEPVSIDYGVLEKSRRVAMQPATFSWTDIGSWTAAAELWPVDAAGNASRDPVLALDAAANVVATRGKPVVLLGVEGLVVVDAGDALLVCARDRCQDVRSAVARLEDAGLGRLR